MVMTRQTFICAPMSMMIEARMAKAKLAANFSVNTAVWVRKPGPMADVAMMKAAPISTDQLLLPSEFLGMIVGAAIKFSLENR